MLTNGYLDKQDVECKSPLVLMIGQGKVIVLCVMQNGCDIDMN